MLCYFWMRKMIMNRKAKVVCSTRYIQHPINCWGSFRTRDLLIFKRWGEVLAEPPIQACELPLHFEQQPGLVQVIISWLNCRFDRDWIPPAYFDRTPGIPHEGTSTPLSPARAVHLPITRCLADNLEPRQDLEAGRVK